MTVLYAFLMSGGWASIQFAGVKVNEAIEKRRG